MLKVLNQKKIYLSLAGAAVLAVVYSWLSFYPDILWFSEVSYVNVFLKVVAVKIALFVVFALFALFVLGSNLYIARFVGQKNRKNRSVAYKGSIFYFIEIIKESMFGGKGAVESEVNITPENDTWVQYLLIIVVVVLSFFLASLAMVQWEVFLKFLHAVPFAKADPLFKKDISFYVFSFPFLSFLKGWLLVLCVFTSALVGWVYFSDSVLKIGRGTFSIPNTAKRHLLLLIAVFFLLMAWHYRLDMFSLLYSSRGVAYGASFTDIYATLPGMWFSLVLSLAIAIIAFVSAFYTLPWALLFSTLVLWGLGLVFFHGFYAFFVQKFIVGPNEITKEKPYIEHNIQYTRDAYGLNSIEEKDFPYEQHLTSSDIYRSDSTIKNVRLWDPLPFIRTLRQVQAIRLYYDFNDVDIDRYTINGETRQVLLSARELFSEKIPERAQNWINKHLKYTHGYGVVMATVSEVLPGGMPKLIVKDIPPVSAVLKIARPEIYFGEKTNEYIITNTKTEEFDYPEGDKNKYTVYQSSGGVKIDSFWRKMLYAFYFKDVRIFLSSYIGKGSKLLYERQIRNRIHKIAPFLKYDQDPYIVVDKKGSLYWLLDAYTMSSQYPYSEPFHAGMNYIRNSVKVVVNAYTGETNFYMYQGDPIAEAYAKIFPAMFKPIAEMPKDLLEHVRYPESLFKIQADMYRIYHMRDAQVFYNQEDLWNTPKKKSSENGEQGMEPYYVMLPLSDSKKEEFMLMTPFTPNGKDNMIAWMAALCDKENYGKLSVYRLPKQTLVYGPLQVDARIDQDPEISKELSLWGQKGSEVFRGNLIVVPVKNSFLYIEPIYLQATSGQIPELKRIIVASGESLGMGATLTQALDSLVGGRRKFSITEQTPAEVAAEALSQYQQARKALQQGDWKSFGSQFDSLEHTLKNMAKP